MKEYRLVLTFKAGENMWGVDDEITKLLGRSDGSGCGFGERDLSYYYNHLNSLRAAVRKMRRMPRKIKCQAWDVTNYSEAYEEKPVSLRGIK